MKTKKILSVLLAILMAFSVMSVGFTAFAEVEYVENITISGPVKWQGGTKNTPESFNLGDCSQYKVAAVKFAYIAEPTILRAYYNCLISEEETVARIEALSEGINYEVVNTLEADTCYFVGVIIRPQENWEFYGDEEDWIVPGKINIGGVEIPDQEGWTDKQLKDYEYTGNGITDVVFVTDEETKHEANTLFGSNSAKIGDIVVALQIFNVEQGEETEETGEQENLNFFQNLINSIKEFFAKIGDIFKNLFS